MVFDNKIKIKRGDIFEIGNHRLMCGDATSKSDVKELTRGDKISLYITDPPYNVNYIGKGKDNEMTIMNDNMSNDKFQLFLKDSFSVASSIMNAGASFYIFYASNTSVEFRVALSLTDLGIRQELIWVKSGIVLGRSDYHWKHEPIIYGWKEGAKHNWYSDRKQTTVINVDKPTRNTLHPTIKPLELYMYFINNSSQKGDIIYDSFGGSGTALIAAEYTHRTAYIMELDPVYCNVILQRVMQKTDLRYKKIKKNIGDDLHQGE